jgi:hypothetical protein
MRAMHRFRLLATVAERTVESFTYRRLLMKPLEITDFFDFSLFLATLFVPVTLLFGGALVLVAEVLV